MLENKDCIMFRDMSVEEQGIIVQALKDKLEVEQCYTKDTGWFKVICKRTLSLDWAYRVIPKRLHVPWYSIRKELCYTVMMKNGSVWLSSKQPLWREDLGEWCIDAAPDIVVVEVSCLDIDTDGIDFRTSLVSRFD